MHISVSRHADVVIVAPEGRIDSTTCTTLQDELMRVLDGGARQLVVDFSGVDYISSAGLRVMLALAKRLRDTRGTLLLCAMNEPVRQVFDLAGFLALFSVEASRQAALARLSPP